MYIYKYIHIYIYIYIYIYHKLSNHNSLCIYILYIELAFNMVK